MNAKIILIGFLIILNNHSANSHVLPSFDIELINALTHSAPTNDLLKYLRILKFLNTFQYKVDNKLLNATDYETFLILIDLLKKRIQEQYDQIAKEERPVYWYSRQG